MKSELEKADDKRIMKLFRGRCVVNLGHPAQEVNEIVLRSRSKEATTTKRNRVPMCRSCHRVYHWGGVTDDKMEKLIELAETRLLSFGVDLEEW